MARTFARLLTAVVIICVVMTWHLQSPSTSSPPDSTSQHRPSTLPDETVPISVSTEAKSDKEQAPKTVATPDGAQVVVNLSESSAGWYLRGDTTGNERFYRTLIANMTDKEVYLSADLGRAAREFVFQYTELSKEPPTDIRNFLLEASGALAADTSFQHLRTNSLRSKALERSIASIIEHPPDGDGPLVVGVGEVFTPGRRTKRHIGVVGTRLPVRLEPLSRRIEPNSHWTIQGQLLVAFRQLKALVLHPGNQDSRVPVDVQGDRFSVRIDTGNKRGELRVQLIGEGPRGPGKLFQLSAYVGVDPPESYVTTLPVSESHITDADAAARYAAQLLNRDRGRHGLAALQWDERLAAIASDHSRDMRDQDFFSHRSPTTGLHSARLAKAGYRASTSAENLALNVSLQEAQSGLMHSLGHRLNILSTRVSHVGVGVVGEELEDGQRRWWVTQLFSKPVKRIDAAQAESEIVSAINLARSQSGQSPLRHSRPMSRLAAEVIDGEERDLNKLTQRMLDEVRAQGLLRSKTRAWAASVADFDTLQLPGFARAERVKSVGLSVRQSTDSTGSIRVLLVFSE